MTAEARWSLAVIAASLVVFGGLLVAAGPFFPTFDEQKYLGIAYNLWSGRGLTTVFGIPFTSHAPLWTVLLGAPHALFGADNLAWGRFLNGIAGLGVVAAAAALAWRVRPAAGAVAAIAMVGMLYLHDQSRTARLDVPAAALGLAYLLVGFEAVRRGSTRWALTAGAVFALGFLVKEVNLPIAPVPFLAGALQGRPWRSVLSVAGWTIVAAAIGAGWWFVLFAQLEHEVYRLGTPAWTLIPIGILVALTAAVGVSADRLAATPRLQQAIAAVERQSPASVRRIGRPLIVWTATLAWVAVLTLVFLRTARLSGTGGLAPSQLALYARTWFGPLAVVIVAGLGAAGLAIVAAIVDRRRVSPSPVWDLTIAAACGVPLILLVVAVGEPPRNYLAQIAVIAALAAVGLVWLVERLLELRRPEVTVPLGAVGGLAAGVIARELLVITTDPVVAPPVLPFAVAGAAVGAALGCLPILAARADPDRGRRIRAATGGAIVAAALVASSAVLGTHALAARPDSTDPAREGAVTIVTAWLREHVNPSQTVAFGSFLGYDMALGLQGRNRTVQVRHRLSVGSAAAPEGIVYSGEAPASDWIAIDIAPRNASQFQAYRAAWLLRDLPRTRTDVWVYSTGIDTAAPSIIPALTPDHGFDLLQHWTFPVGGGEPIETFVFRVHLDRISFDTSRIYVSPEALDRLVTILGARPAVAAPAARALSERAVVTPPDPAAGADLDRLRILAGG